MKVTLYQTIEDRNNPEEVENKGPFPTRNKSAWLGYGHYFWDTHIKLAHQWGKTVYPDNYVICKAFANIDDTCWDLHGNGMHLVHFKEICDEIVGKKIARMDKLTVARVIEYLKKKNAFIYTAIRANAVNSFTKGFKQVKIRFKSDGTAYMELYPLVQICIIEKKGLSLRNYHIVYPTSYALYQYA